MTAYPSDACPGLAWRDNPLMDNFEDKGALGTGHFGFRIRDSHMKVDNGL
ncbi:hypothetical protein [Endozoicomonas sp. SESOKO1]|nr:hypothetical protein [Endozoicomonas sp. SESOKO1]